MCLLVRNLNHLEVHIGGVLIGNEEIICNVNMFNYELKEKDFKLCGQFEEERPKIYISFYFIKFAGVRHD